MRNHMALLGAVLVIAAALPVLADTPFKLNATAGTRHYRYTSFEQPEGQLGTRYRVDFDLVTDASNGVTAVVRKAESAKGDIWSTPVVSDECKKALQGSDDALARVTLSPLSPEAAAALGEPFMAMCAPAAYFYPMTDILNVSLIQTSPLFHLADLTSTGKSARFEGFHTKLDRFGTAMVASSPGGTITLTSLDDHVANVDWAPDPMALTLVQRATQTMPELTMSGFERFAFRVVIDRASGTLVRATTTLDSLNLVVSMQGLPPDKAPHLAIKREVAIEPRD